MQPWQVGPGEKLVTGEQVSNRANELAHGVRVYLDLKQRVVRAEGSKPQMGKRLRCEGLGLAGAVGSPGLRGWGLLEGRRRCESQAHIALGDLRHEPPGRLAADAVAAGLGVAHRAGRDPRRVGQVIARQAKLLPCALQPDAALGGLYLHVCLASAGRGEPGSSWGSAA